MCLCMSVHVCGHVCEGQKTTCSKQFFSFCYVGSEEQAPFISFIWQAFLPVYWDIFKAPIPSLAFSWFKSLYVSFTKAALCWALRVTFLIEGPRVLRRLGPKTLGILDVWPCLSAYSCLCPLLCLNSCLTYDQCGPLNMPSPLPSPCI